MILTNSLTSFALSLQDILNNSEIQSLLSKLMTLIDTSVSIEDINGNLLLEQLTKTIATQKYPILVSQEVIGFVRGNSSVQMIADLLSYLAQQQILILFDELTKIPNRRYFDRYFRQEWRRCQREYSTVSLLLCDLDYFKSYNDYYGHQQGDRCLKKVAQILQEILRRPGDMVFRYGGEEFAIVLPNTTSEGAEFIAEQIIQRMQVEQLVHHLSPISSYVSISIGVAVTSNLTVSSSETLFEMADTALYLAKAKGRNCYYLQTILK